MFHQPIDFPEIAGVPFPLVIHHLGVPSVVEIGARTPGLQVVFLTLPMTDPWDERYIYLHLSEKSTTCR